MEYIFSRHFDCYVYTIDMVRLKTYFKSYESYQSQLNELTFMGLSYWSGRGYGKFLNNYKLDGLWIGIDTYRTKNSKDGNIFCIEFNPNKLTSNSLTLLLSLLHRYDWSISRFDLAIDIPLNINQVIFTNLYKKSYSMFYTDFNNKTYYFGRGDGHVKIYNKKIESSLDYELTRYEVTKTCDIPLIGFTSSHFDFHFLDIAFSPYVSSSADDETLNAILYAVNNGYPYRSLSRHYREVIKKDFLGCYDLNNDFANACFTDFVHFLKSRFI